MHKKITSLQLCSLWNKIQINTDLNIINIIIIIMTIIS